MPFSKYLLPRVQVYLYKQNFTIISRFVVFVKNVDTECIFWMHVHSASMLFLSKCLSAVTGLCQKDHRQRFYWSTKVRASVSSFLELEPGGTQWREPPHNWEWSIRHADVEPRSSSHLWPTLS